MDRRAFLSVSGLAVAATAVPAVLDSALAGTPGTLPARSVSVRLDKGRYTQGEVMTLTIEESISKRRISVTDSSGTVWKRHSNTADTCVYKATAGDTSPNEVTVVVTRRRDGASTTRTVDYKVALLHGGGGSGTPRWAGHQPGKILLGLSSADIADSVAATGPIGLRRTYYNWNDPGEDKAIKADHASGRMPWVSFKPPGGSTAGWAALASGAYDADIKAMAQRYAGYKHPVISTFHHEPTNDGGNPADWAAAYVRLYDVIEAETGHANLAFVPIIGDWEFNPRNRDGQPDAFLTAPVLERLPFLGIDLYQNSSNDGFDKRLARIIDWLDYRGVVDPMVGIGETGCCLVEDPQPHRWLKSNWDWAVANIDKIGAMSYFDSTRNSKDGHIWRLDETPEKLATYKALLDAPQSTTL